MKWAHFILCVALCGCTITVKPIAPEKPPVKKIAAHSKAKSNSTTPPPVRGELVDSEWLKNYKQLEADHGNFEIPEDQKIIAVDSRFKVSKAVIEHYQDMVKADIR